MADWLHGALSLSSFTQICVARGRVSWGSEDNAAEGELELWYDEGDNNYCLYASNTAGCEIFYIMPETTVKVTKDSLTISELEDFHYQKGQTVQLKDADPNDIQLFIHEMPASVKENMEDLRGASVQTPALGGDFPDPSREIRQHEANLERQLREMRQREENLQRQLRDTQQREENLQRQLRETQLREENSQRQLREMRQREENSQRQLRETQQREGNSQRQLREMQQREENSQRQLREMQQREENSQRQLREMQQREENLQRQLREKDQEVHT